RADLRSADLGRALVRRGCGARGGRGSRAARSGRSSRRGDRQRRAAARRSDRDRAGSGEILTSDARVTYPNSMGSVRIAIVGVGNCASSLVQGTSFYRGADPDRAVGLMHWEIGGYRPSDLEVAAAFDVDLRKVGKDVAEAIFEKPNCTAVFCDRVPKTGVRVRMGRILDGVSEHFEEYPEDRRFLVSDQKESSREEIVAVLRDAKVDVLVNYLPVGSERASRFYAECALEAGVAVVNCIPVFLASDPAFAARFAAARVPIIGDDIKAQLGATITHRSLTDLFAKRGVKIDRTYQLNTGGNTDFLNMLNRSRLAAKKVSKTEAVQSVAPERIADDNIHVG